VNEIADIFATGIVLGLSAGLSPGPLMTLVVAESLKGGASAGIRIALAPLVTDAPIISSAFCCSPPLPRPYRFLAFWPSWAVFSWLGWG
jgi:threonine/homoserine/homoserine lactone efflux protein